MTIDYYSLCESAAMAKMRTLSSFFPNPEFVTDNDSILNQGNDFYAVFTPDTFPASPIDGKSNLINWNIMMDVYARFTTQSEAKSRIKSIRAEILLLFHPASLNSVLGVSRTVLSTNGGLFQDAPQNPNFVWQTFIITVTQRVTFSF